MIKQRSIQQCISEFLDRVVAIQAQGYACLYDVLKRFLRYRFSGQQEVFYDEVVQDTLMKVHKDQCSVNPSMISNANSWLTTIAKNTALDLIKRQTKSTKETEYDEADNSNSAQNDVTPSAESQFENEQSFQGLFDAFYSDPHISEDDQVIIEGMMLGLTSAEIGQQLNRSSNAITQRRHHLKNKLKKLISLRHTSNKE